MTDQMTTEAYLEAEFRRYFPDAVRIDVDNNVDDEMITVAVQLPNVDGIWAFGMMIGSDDDMFRFEPEADTPDSMTITIPFQPEA